MTSALRPGGSTRRWRRRRLGVIRRDGGVCQVRLPDGSVCGQPANVAGHVIAREYAGHDDPRNLRAECSYHSSSEGARIKNGKHAGQPAGLNTDREW